MKVVVAIDSFKGSLSSMEAGRAVKDGIISVIDHAEVKVIPVADGGEGTVDALILGLNGRKECLEVTGPLGEKVSATYGIVEDQKLAIIEMAEACGLPLVDPEKRNPLYTTTYGVGEIIKEAISKGCRDFIIGIGGSSTNDGGIGMLQALGFEFYDQEGHAVGVGGQVLSQIVSIKTENQLPELNECSFKIACDVNNPLYGINGAAHIYGPQKGATSEIVEVLDEGLKHYAEIVKKELNLDLAHVPGAGAAGGIGYGFLVFLNGKLESGVDIVMKVTSLEDHIFAADFVITGEGRLDQQTAMGKVPIGVAKIAKKHHAKVIALAGSVREGAEACNKAGIDSYFSIQCGPISLEEAMNPNVAAQNIKNTTVQIFNLIKTAHA